MFVAVVAICVTPLKKDMLRIYIPSFSFLMMIPPLCYFLWHFAPSPRAQQQLCRLHSKKCIPADHQMLSQNSTKSQIHALRKTRKRYLVFNPIIYLTLGDRHKLCLHIFKILSHLDVNISMNCLHHHTVIIGLTSPFVQM